MTRAAKPKKTPEQEGHAVADAADYLQRVENMLREQCGGLMTLPPASDGAPRVITEPFVLPNITMEHVKQYLGDILGSASTLEDVATLHPKAEIRFAAQRALADIANILLKKWPAAKAGYMKFPYDWLMQKAGSGLKQRWEKELHLKKQPKPGHKEANLKPLDQARWRFISSVWTATLMRTINVAAAIAQPERKNAILTDVLLNVGGIERQSKVVDASLQSFYEVVPNFATGLLDRSINPWAANLMIVRHFDLFWQTVIEPLANEGSPSAWRCWRDQELAGFFPNKKGSWEIWSAWSAHAPSMKRLLLQWLRVQHPEHGSQTPKDVPFLVLGRPGVPTRVMQISDEKTEPLR